MTVPQSLARLTAVELSAGVASGALSAERVAREHLDRIAEREPSVGAWVHLDPDQVMTQARALDRAAVQGPLHGVPVGIKDIIATADMPTQYGSPIYRHHLGRRLRRGVARGGRDHLRQDCDHGIRHELCRQDRESA